MTKQNLPIMERFMMKVSPEPNSGCWLWTASCMPDGYGQIKIGGRPKRAHRVSWELHHGPIPKLDSYHGNCVLHKCDVPQCVNPDHLFIGTQADNMKDKVRKNRQDKGRDINTVKLTEKQVLEIFHAPGTQRKIATKYGIDQSQVSHIKTSKNWSFVTQGGAM